MIFKELQPNELDNNPNTILEFKELKSNGKYRFFYLLLINNYLILASKGIFPAMNGKPEYWSGGSDLELPKQGLSWFIKVIEEKFMKTEAEGGLKKEEFTFSEIINDEKLVTLRWFGTPGYALANDSRQSYISTTKKRQEFCFTDTMLFENGLFDQLKEIAKKIEAGEI